tara:strand:- start:8741 stop:9145 length:405 start_codon:yes stop_codon:yes gene_type:complete
MSFIAGAIILSSAVSAGAGAYNKSKDRKAQKKQQRENRKTERRNNISAILGGGRSGGVSGQQAISGSGMGDALTALAQMGQAYAAVKGQEQVQANKIKQIEAHNTRPKGNSVMGFDKDGNWVGAFPKGIPVRPE